jgi:hypothetical protein
MKRYYLPLLLLTLLLGAWTAGAQNNESNSCGSGCRDSHSECRRVARDDERVCRRDCKDAVRTATASEREICEVQGLTEKECRGRIITAARAASESCLPDCREGLKQQKKQCHHQTRICSQVCKGDLGPVCAEQCQETRQACAEGLRTCRHTCHEDRRQAIRDCRDSSSNREEFRECRTDAITASRECGVDCHDTNLCREETRDCMETCQSNGSNS